MLNPNKVIPIENDKYRVVCWDEELNAPWYSVQLDLTEATELFRKLSIAWNSRK